MVRARGCGKQHCCHAAAVKSHILTVQRRGTVTLPVDFRRRVHLDQENAQVELIEQEDGRVELVPIVATPYDQSWFWTECWQVMERQADADIAAARSTAVDGLEGLIAHLDV